MGPCSPIHSIYLYTCPCVGFTDRPESNYALSVHGPLRKHEALNPQNHKPQTIITIYIYIYIFFVCIHMYVCM